MPRNPYERLTRESIGELLNTPVQYEKELSGKRLEKYQQIKTFYSGISEPYYLIDFQYFEWASCPGIPQPQDASEIIPVTYDVLYNLLQSQISRWHFGRAIPLVHLTRLCSPCYLPKIYQLQVAESLTNHSFLNFPDELMMEDFRSWINEKYMMLEWESEFSFQGFFQEKPSQKKPC